MSKASLEAKRIRYIVVHSPCSMGCVFKDRMNEGLRPLKKIGSFSFYASLYMPSDVYIAHKSQQTLEELVNMYAMCGGDTTRITINHVEIKARTTLFMDCAKLLEAIK